jgi:Lon protease-like protein
MKRNPLEPDNEELPQIIPVFPLRGALMLPERKLPLNIFEPRYLNLVHDVLKTPHRVFGMIQPKTAAPRNEMKPSLYSIGCLGRISCFEETDDGRFLISLDGLIRFRLNEEVEMQEGYRRLSVNYDEFVGDRTPNQCEVNRDRLFSVLQTYFALKEFTVDWDAIRDCCCEKLITTLAMICPLEPEDKQVLLEASGTMDRCDILITLMEMENSAHKKHSGNENNVRH